MLVVFVLAVTLSACGEGSHIDKATAQQLQSKVADISTAVQNRQVDVANRELVELQTMVGGFESNGKLTNAQGDRVLSAASNVQQQLLTITTTQAPSSATTTAPPQDAHQLTTKPSKGGKERKGDG